MNNTHASHLFFSTDVLVLTIFSVFVVILTLIFAIFGIFMALDIHMVDVPLEGVLVGSHVVS